MSSIPNIRETVDIIEDLVAELNLVVEFTTVVDNGGNLYTITTCNTSYLFPFFKFDLDAVTYTVQKTGFVFNASFVVKGSVVPTALQVTLDPLKYFHGTVIATKAELDKQKLSSNKFPMVYFLETFSDDFDEVASSAIDRNSSVRLFFLSETTKGDEWNTNQHYDFSIKPMRNMVYQFVNHLRGSNKIGKFDTYTATNHAKFGVNVSDSGHTQRIFNADLSGVELSINLPIRKALACSTC